MSLHVELQRALPHECLHANFAFEGPGVRMLPLMIDEMSLRREALSASLEFTAERLLAGVDPHVRLQIAILCEASAADLALERFFTGVRSLVDLEAARAGVGLAADVATVGLLACVDEDVGLQVALRDERLAAVRELARKWTVVGVRSHVRLEVPSFVELFDT